MKIENMADSISEDLDRALFLRNWLTEKLVEAEAEIESLRDSLFCAEHDC